MHESSYNAMREIVEKHLDKDKKLSIIDIGSYDVNGSYKPLFDSSNWTYEGLDIIEGPNVDIIVEPYNWVIADSSYDVVISGQCLEHVEKPWLWIKNVERICKPGGLIVVIVPWNCGPHGYPVDCWRILGDGLRVLFTKCVNLDVIKCEIINSSDTVGMARKRDYNKIVDKAIKFQAVQVKEELIWLIEKILLLENREIAVELGTCTGGTFYVLTQIFNKVLSIDVEKRELPFSTREQDQYIIGNTKDSEIISKVDKVDFLLIDADHRYEGVSEDFALWKSKVREGGIIAFHDIEGALETDGVKKFWEDLKQSGNYKTDEISLTERFYGIGIIWV